MAFVHPVSVNTLGKLPFNGLNALMLSNAFCCHKAIGIHFLSVMKLIFNMYFVPSWQKPIREALRCCLLIEANCSLLQERVPQSRSYHNVRTHGFMLPPIHPNVVCRFSLLLHMHWTDIPIGIYMWKNLSV